jgi:metal-dependent amidase/aminoacylase/carboxypeptidase family protein
MKTVIVLAVVAFVTPLTTLAQDARDIAREMGADTTTSISPGTDRNGVHRDTETSLESRQHAPNLLETVQASKVKKQTKAQRKQLLQKRESLLKERKTAAEAAVAAARKTEMTLEKSFTSEEAAANEAVVRKKAEKAWDAKRRKELDKIDSALKEGSDDTTEVRLHAPSLIKPK